jgi:hypothetical protein
VVSSSLREVLESPHDCAEKAASALRSNANIALHFLSGEEFSSRVSVIRTNRQKQGEIIAELEATESHRITLYIPLDDEATVYAKVWPR